MCFYAKLQNFCKLRFRAYSPYGPETAKTSLGALPGWWTIHSCRSDCLQPHRSVRKNGLLSAAADACLHSICTLLIAVIRLAPGMPRAPGTCALQNLIFWSRRTTSPASFTTSAGCSSMLRL